MDIVFNDNSVTREILSFCGDNYLFHGTVNKAFQNSCINKRTTYFNCFLTYNMFVESGELDYIIKHKYFRFGRTLRRLERCNVLRTKTRYRDFEIYNFKIVHMLDDESNKRVLDISIHFVNGFSYFRREFAIHKRDEYVLNVYGDDEPCPDWRHYLLSTYQKTPYVLQYKNHHGSDFNFIVAKNI